MTKGKLLRAVWGKAYQGEDSYVYVHVSQLRHKLAAADPSGALRDLIVTEPGVGYRVRAAGRPAPSAKPEKNLRPRSLRRASSWPCSHARGVGPEPTSPARGAATAAAEAGGEARPHARRPPDPGRATERAVLPLRRRGPARRPRGRVRAADAGRPGARARPVRPVRPAALDP